MAASHPCVDTGRSVQQLPAKSHPDTTGSTSSHNRTSDGTVKGSLSQQLPVLSWGHAVGMRQDCASDGCCAADVPLLARPSPLGLSFSDLVRQSMTHAHVSSAAMGSHEEQGSQNRGTSTAVQPVAQSQRESVSMPLETSSYDHVEFGIVEGVLRDSSKQPGHMHSRAVSPTDEQPSSIAASRATSVFETREQQPQRSCSASSFTGILGESCMTDTWHGNTMDHSLEPTMPSQPAERPSGDSRSSQGRHTQDAESPALYSSPVERVLHTQSSVVDQRSSPATVEQLLPNMQQLQIMQHKPRQQVDSAFNYGRTDPLETPPSGLRTYVVHEGGSYEDAQASRLAPVPHMQSNPGVHDMPPAERLPQLKKRAEGHSFRIGGPDETGVTSKVCSCSLYRLQLVVMVLG